MADAPDERRFEMAGAHELHHGALWIRIGDHGVTVMDFTIARLHTDDPSVINDNPANRAVGPHVRAGRTGRLRQQRGYHPHTTPGDRHLAVIPCQAIEVGQYRAGRTWPEIRSQHGIEADGTPQQRAAKTLDHLVVHVHPDEAQELPHLGLAEPTDIEAQPCQCGQVSPVGRSESWRRPVHGSAQQIPKAGHTPAETAVLLHVIIGHAANRVT